MVHNPGGKGYFFADAGRRGPSVGWYEIASDIALKIRAALGIIPKPGPARRHRN